MRSLTRSVAAVCGALLLAVTVVGCSSEGVEEPVLSSSSSSSTADKPAEADEQAESTDTQPASNASEADCSLNAIERDFGDEDDWILFECEGDFAYVGADGTEFHFPAMWKNGKWTKIQNDGYVERALPAPCYSQSTVDGLGIGPKVRSSMLNCATGKRFDDDTSESGKTDVSQYITQVGLGEAGMNASFPDCDGRLILILDSVVDDPSLGDTQDRLAQAALLDKPFGKEFTVPGQCASLRKQVDGHDIYPVYLDFGKDKSAACSAKSRYGGNVRPLIDGDFASGNNQSVDEARLALDPC